MVLRVLLVRRRLPARKRLPPALLTNASCDTVVDGFFKISPSDFDQEYDFHCKHSQNIDHAGNQSFDLEIPRALTHKISTI